MPKINWLGQYERSAVWGVSFGVAYLWLHDSHPLLTAIGSLSAANVVYLLLTWAAFQRLKADDLKRWAARPFPAFLQAHPWLDFWLLGGRTGLSFVLSASFFGFVAALLFLPLAGRLGLERGQVVLVSALCLLTVACSWLTAHLAYALHYAFLYYRRPVRGLSFPEDDAPDLMDFAYFALTIGATFASSDIDVTSKEMRRKVLGHTLFSFVFNTAILALAVQFAAGG